MSNTRNRDVEGQYLGKRYTTKDGTCEFEIVEVRSFADVTIKFIPSGILKNTKISNINRGITSPFVNARTGAVSPICFDTPQHEYEGTVYRTNENYLIKIIKFIDSKNVQYQFLDEFGSTGYTSLQNIQKGQVRNLFKRNEYGGYLGSSLEFRGSEYDWLNNIWKQLLIRVYEKNNKPTNISDKVLIDQNWYCYSLFASWYIGTLSNLNSKYQYTLNKDILYPYYSQFSKGQKVFSPFTCILLPKIIDNILFTNNKVLINNELEKLLNDGAIDIDTYSVLKRFYVQDPNYANYITNKYDQMRINLSGL